MTITLGWWMLVPLALVLWAAWLFYEGEHETGQFGGIFHMMFGLCLLVGAALFMLGRWLS